jgi:hypothetical protein
VASSWSSGSPPSDPLERLDFRLRKLAKDLQRWNRKHVGNVRDQLLVANEIILQLDIAQESRPLSEPEL